MNALTFRDILYLIGLLGVIVTFYFTNNQLVSTKMSYLESEVKELRKDIKRFQAPLLLERIDDNTYRIIILEQADKRSQAK